MQTPAQGSSTYLRKLFLFNHAAGLLIGGAFPFFAYLVLGESALTPLFFVTCTVFGFCLGAASFWFVRQTLKKQLQQQLQALHELLGDEASDHAGQTVEGLFSAVSGTVSKVRNLLTSLHRTVDEFVPHYQALADASRYLSARAEDGLQAAQRARTDVDAMHQKQQTVIAQVENLTNRSQDEAAISRELSASLEEMAGALEHSSQKFLETTRNVDEMVSSIQNATSQAEQMSHVTESTARDLDQIGEALDRLRAGVADNAESSAAVKQDAEQGVKVVQSFTMEMERIDAESRKAIVAMQRLSRQTVEVAKIVEVIKDLVSDTELLAFNAAIIAAKAGAEGRGFAVVAEEIRDLADRTTTSADEIEAIIKSIRKDTEQVNTSVESTGHFIGRGKELSRSTAQALGKIVESSSQAAADCHELSQQTAEQGRRARSMIDQAGGSLRSVRAIVATMGQQNSAISRIDAGVDEMKSAADQIARGFDEQVKANHEFDRSLMAREEQIQAIFGATRFQMETVEKIFTHFGRSEERLSANARKSSIIIDEINELERLAEQLRELASCFQAGAAPAAVAEAADE
ncbi:MAG: methyl-accepting chemotaxis protein [Desulfuromonadales bacterium]|jgi:methyl-accepting chemotaxis protein|nr:methyl-accepting chemotaxis protein [Desulfuromonadales bacterium]